MTKALEVAKFGRESAPAGTVVGDSDTQTLSAKTFSDMPVFSAGVAASVPYLSASKVLTTDSGLTFNGTTLGVTGNVNAAGLTLSGGTVNGIGYLNGSKVFITGSELTFDGTNFGIGSSAPEAKLTVIKDLTSGGDATGFRLNANTTANRNILFGGPSTLLDASFWQAYREATVGAGPRSLLLNPLGGNVGIGTSNPTYKLDVISADYPAARISSTYTSSNKTYSSLLAGIPAANQGSFIGFVYDSITSANSFTHITPYGYAEGALFSITSAGNIGIGITLPAEKLHIQGKLRVFDGGYPYIDLGVGTSNYFRIIHDNPTDRLLLGKNGVAAFGIDGSGYVHFYTAGVAGSGSVNLTSADPFIRFTGTGTADKKKWDIRAISATGSEALEFRTVNDANNVFSTKLWITHSGKFGFGTTAPAAQLHIQNATGNYGVGGTDNTGMLLIESTFAGATADSNASLTTRNYYGYGQFMQWQSYGMRIGNRTILNGGSGAVSFTYGNDSVGMYLGNTGNLGIGTSEPQSKLEINLVGTANLASATITKITDFAAASRAGFMHLLNNNDGVYFGTGANNHIGSGFGFFREAGGWNSALAFYTNNITSGPNGTGAIQEKMRLNSDGWLGIGTKTPYTQLDVNGGIRAQSTNNTIGGLIAADSNNVAAKFARITGNGSDVAFGQNIITYPGTWTKATVSEPSGGWVVGTDGNAAYYKSAAGNTSPLQNALLTLSSTGLNMGGGSLYFERSGIRSWQLYANQSTGQAILSSGDGVGTLTLASAGMSIATSVSPPTNGLRIGGATNPAGGIVSTNLIQGYVANNYTGTRYWVLHRMQTGAGVEQSAFNCMGDIHASSYTTWNLCNLWIRREYATTNVYANITGMIKNSVTVSVVDITYNNVRYVAIKFAGGDPGIEANLVGYLMDQMYTNGTDAFFINGTGGVSENAVIASY